MDKSIKGFFWFGDVNDYYLGHQFNEIFKDRIYAPYIEGKKDPVILDVGACIGVFSLYASSYAKQVYALEPAIEHYDCLVKMLSYNRIRNVKPINKALYHKDTKLPLYHAINKTMHSLYRAMDGLQIRPEEVDCIALDTLFEEEKIEHVDLMKLDCEGSESEILSSAGFKKVASKIDTIVGEIHGWGIRHPNQIKDALIQNGFTFDNFRQDINMFIAQRNGN